MYDVAASVEPDGLIPESDYQVDVPPNPVLLGDSGRLQFSLEADLGLSLEL